MFKHVAITMAVVALSTTAQAQTSWKPVTIEARGRAPIVHYFGAASIKAEAVARENLFEMIGHIPVNGTTVHEATATDAEAKEAVARYVRSANVTSRSLVVDKHYAEARIKVTLGNDFYGLFTRPMVASQSSEKSSSSTMVINATGEAPIGFGYANASLAAEANARRQLAAQVDTISINGTRLHDLLTNQAKQELLAQYLNAAQVTSRRIWIDRGVAQVKLVLTLDNQFFALATR